METLKTIIYKCSCCGKKYRTTQEWFDKQNKDGKLICHKCRISIYNNKKESIKWKY